MDAGNDAKPWTKRDEVSYWKRMHEDEKERNKSLLATIDRLQALNKELVKERDRLREFVGAFCVASANLNENRREPYWLALMHIHDMAQLVLSRAKDS